jgi:hypothetical protein
MTVIAWIVETTWRACIGAAREHTPADSDIVLLHVTDPDLADLAHGAYAGLLGRGHPERDPGTALEGIASTAAQQLLTDAAVQLGRPCQQAERSGRAETEVIAAAEGARLLVVVRDGDPTQLGPPSLSHTCRYIIDHAPCPVLLIWPGPPPTAKTVPPTPHPPQHP